MNKSLNISSTTTASHQDWKEDEIERFEHVWIPVLTVSIITILLTIWCAISFARYGIKYKKWKRNGRRNRMSGQLMTAALLAPCLTLPRLSSTLVLIFTGHFAPRDDYGDVICRIIMKINALLYYVASVSSFVYLWYRQRMLYQQPSLKHLNTGAIRTFSWISFVVATVGGLTNEIVIVLPNEDHQLTKYGCINTSRFEFFYSYLVLFLILAFSNISMLILFCYPLFNHTASKDDAAAPATTADDVCTLKASRQGKTRRRLVLAMKRATMSAIICLVAEFVAMMSAVLILPQHMPGVVLIIIYDVDLCANLVSIMFSFQRFRELIVIPFQNSKLLHYSTGSFRLRLRSNDPTSTNT